MKKPLLPDTFWQDPGVAQEQEALRAMWQRNPYSQDDNDNAAPAPGQGAGRVAGGIAQLLAEAEAEEWAAHERAADRMAEEFAQALMRLDLGGPALGLGHQAGSVPLPPGAAEPSRAPSARRRLSGRSTPSGSENERDGDSSPSGRRRSMPGGRRRGAPGPPGRQPMRELLRALEESLAAGLDPAALTREPPPPPESSSSSSRGRV